MSFCAVSARCTVVNCIDGRVQMPVIEFLKKRFSVDFVDSITEVFPVRILAGETNRRQVQSILDRIEISINTNHSKALAVAAHHDCNPVDKQKQLEYLGLSIKFLKGQYTDLDIIGLWVDVTGVVSEISVS